MLRLTATFLLVFLPTLLPLKADEIPNVAHPDPGPVRVPSCAFTTKIRPELAGAHPRLFLDTAGLAALRKKAKEPAMEPYIKSFFASANLLATEAPPEHPANTEDPFRGFGDRLVVVAMAYLLSDDPKYLQSAVTWMDAIAHYPSWAGDTDLAAGHICFGMAVAYDWLYPALTQEQRKNIEGCLRLHGRLVAQSDIHSLAKSQFWGGAYFQNHCWINNTGLAAAAMALYDVDHDEAQGWLDLTRTSFQITYKHFGLDGGNSEGGGYARYGTDWILRYVEALRAFSGEDLRDMPYLKGAAQFLCDNVMPDGHSVVTFTDWSPSAHDLSGETTLLWAAAYFHDGGAEWFRQFRRNALNIHEDHVSGGAIGPFSLLWMDPAIKPVPPDNKLLTHIYPDLGMVFFRTKWAEGAAMVSFVCGPPGGQHVMRNWTEFPHAYDAFGHDHPSANSFVFWADHDWRIGAPGGYTHFKATHNENVWMADGKGQRGESEWFKAETYVGSAQQPHLVEVESSDDAGYVAGEAAPAYYPESHVTGFLRHLVFVKGTNPYVVVYDKVEADRPVNWSAYFHDYQPFQVTDDHFTVGGNTTTFGSFTGSSALGYDDHPLVVLGHPDKKPAQKGFELGVTPAGPSASAWLVTVVGQQARDVHVTASDSTFTVQVGSETMAWDAQDHVKFNGALISANLLPASNP